MNLFPLVTRVEDGQHVVGRLATGDFVALPAVGGSALALLQSGASLREARERLAAEYDADIDLEGFVSSLIDLGFVQAVDGHPIAADDAKQPNWPWLQPHHVSWLFTRPVLVGYIALVLSAVATLLTHEGLLPKPRDFFWSTTSSLVVAGNTGIFLVVLALHELAHLAAARSLGVRARIGLGTRLLDLVVQTDVTGLWAVPRRQRYRVYLAGMACDLALASGALLLLAAGAVPPLGERLLKALLLLLVIGIAGQFRFYMRTDVYFVVLDLLRCRNMFGDALAYLGHLAHRLRRRAFRLGGTVPRGPLADLPAAERRHVRVYAWLVLVGSAATLALFAVYELPVLVGLFGRASQAVLEGLRLGQPWRVADGAVTLVVEGTLLLLFVTTFLRQRGWWPTSRPSRAPARGA